MTRSTDQHILGDYIFHTSRQNPYVGTMTRGRFGDLLGAHGGLFQKWYMAYEEALRVPLTVVLPGSDTATSVSTPTSHIDLAPTILGLAGIDMDATNAEIASGFTDALPLVGRDLSPVLRRETDATAFEEPIYFMTDDDPSRGLDQRNFIGLSYDSVAQPNHVETVIAEIEGEIWKYDLPRLAIPFAK